jgi:hypothetical protein
MCGLPVGLECVSLTGHLALAGQRQTVMQRGGRLAARPPTDKTDMPGSPGPTSTTLTSLYSLLHYRFHSSLGRHRKKWDLLLSPKYEYKRYFLLKGFSDSEMDDENTKIVTFVYYFVVYKHNSIYEYYCKFSVYFKTQSYSRVYNLEF